MASTTSQIPATMRAMRYTDTSNGIESTLKLDISVPLPPAAKNLKPDEALIEVLTMAVNPADYKLAEWWVSKFLITKPASPGLDFAGRVASLGKNLQSQYRPGQLVFGRLGDDVSTSYGTLSSYIIARREGFAAIPEGVSVDDAASVGTAGLTAYQTIVPYAKTGGSVFIHGGSGGTGIWGIQMAKAMGCFVTTSCSGANVDLCRSLGADVVIDYRTQNIIKELQGMDRKFDLVVDNVANMGELYWQCHTFTNPGASFVQVGGEPSFGSFKILMTRLLWPSFLGGGKRPFVAYLTYNKHDDLVQIGQWLKEGKIKPVKEEVFAYEDAARAFIRLKSHRVKGKLLIRVNEDGRE